MSLIYITGIEYLFIILNVLITTTKVYYMFRVLLHVSKLQTSLYIVYVALFLFYNCNLNEIEWRFCPSSLIFLM